MKKDTYWIRDTIAILSIIAVGYLLILAGSAFGIDHCQRNHCVGYEDAH